MISYVTVGADDIPQAKRFYTAFLPALGYELEEGPEGLSYEIPELLAEPAVSPAFYVKPPFDGHPASVGNGTMVAFRARSEQEVRELHSAALAANGRDEGDRASAMHMALISMLDIYATLRATRSHCFPTTWTSPDGTDNQPYAKE